MNDSILMAIESLCDDIATNPEADDNRKRAEAIACLAISDIFVLDTEDEATEGEDETAKRTGCVQAVPIAPEAGKRFDYQGATFVVLGVEQGGILAVAERPLEERLPFDKDNCNDWRKSSLRKYLNEELPINKNDLMPFVSDLTADDGMTDYGTSVDYVAIISDGLYRKYRAVMPKYDIPVWTITPYSCLPSHAFSERVVNTDGTVYYSPAYSSYGVAPACLFNPSIFNNPRR